MQSLKKVIVNYNIGLEKETYRIGANDFLVAAQLKK
jgi:hypothetical protein